LCHSSLELDTIQNPFHYQKFVKYQRIYRRNISVGNLRLKLPTDTFPSVIQSVTTDEIFSVRNSVGNYRRKVSVGSYRLNYGRKSFRIKKKGGSLTWRFWRVICFSTESPTDSKRQSVQWRDRFAVSIADGLTEGFEMADPYSDVSMFLSESPTECPSVKLSEKVNIWQLWRPTPPLFLLLLLNPNSPHLQTTSPPSPPPKKINLPHINTTSYISWSFVVTASVFWFTDGFYQFL